MRSGWGTSYKLALGLCPLTEERTVSFISVFLLVGGRGSGIESGEARNEGFIFFLHLLLIKTLIGALPSTSSAPQTGVYICLGLRGHIAGRQKTICCVFILLEEVGKYFKNKAKIILRSRMQTARDLF